MTGRAEKLGLLYSRSGDGRPFEIKIFRKVWRYFTRYHSLYLTVYENGDHWYVQVTNGPDYHNRANGEHAYAASICKGSGDPYQKYDLSGAWKSAIGMIAVGRGEGADAIFDYVTRMIDLAYEQHVR